ncbi:MULTISPECIES: NUDIX hydrolase [unclassified Sphingomonas]|uniref:NUDIX hydrolase n=1 Tax=unclassified Sphingomonas TaxID=196159 RepID=UPI00138F739A|nr:NUDIX hydrolase [Sphingomonas sp. CFBP9021]MDY0968671.1 NUDIX hydrolase [Sphingomonas sp. CFBP9021]
MQSAAIPYRNSRLNGIEVLLVTSRKRSRWVLPKGKVKQGMPAHRSAAREAFEEAGVTGTISALLVGTYHQLKTQDDGQAEMVAVQAFPMLVRQENKSWPEMHQRQRCWMPINTAIGAVRNSELRAVLIMFAQGLPNVA